MLDRVIINKFRNFQENQEIKLGRKITIFSGQNGTLKTSLIGAIAQCFALLPTDVDLLGRRMEGNENDIFMAHPLVDSENLKTPTINIYNKDDEPFIVYANDGTKYTRDTAQHGFITRPRVKPHKKLRHWSGATSHEAGNGRRHYPVKYLGLERLWPIAVAESLKDSSYDSIMTERDIDLFIDIYQKITSIRLLKENLSVIMSKRVAEKRSIGIGVPGVPGIVMSAGQDNLSQIVLALASFARRKDAGGSLLIIDEIETSLHPDLLFRLLEYFQTQKDIQDLQLILTTHSFDVFQKLLNDRNKDGVRKDPPWDIQHYYLWKSNGKYINVEHIFSTMQMLSIKYSLYGSNMGKNTKNIIFVLLEDEMDKKIIDKILSSMIDTQNKFETIALRTSGDKMYTFKWIEIFNHQSSLVMINLVGGDLQNNASAYIKKHQSTIIPENVTPYIYFTPMDKAPEIELLGIFEGHSKFNGIDFSTMKEALNCHMISNPNEFDTDILSKNKIAKKKLAFFEEEYQKVYHRSFIDLLIQVWKEENSTRVDYFKKEFLIKVENLIQFTKYQKV